LSSGKDIYLGVNVRDDFGDVRFTKSDGETLLDYWMETKVNGNYAVFWVEVDSIPASPGSVTIYVYYGKSDQASTGNGEATFQLFDHFDDGVVDASKWTKVEAGGGTVTESGTELRCQHDPATRYAGIISILSFTTKFSVLTRAKPGSPASQVDRWARIKTATGIYAHYSLNNYVEWINAGNRRFGAYDGAYHIFDLAYDGSNHRFYMDDTLGVDFPQATTGNAGQLYFGNPNEEANRPGDDYFDWIAVRNYVYPEPSHGAWGSEEFFWGPQPTKIELRVSDVEPPDPDTPKTIYRDRFNLPDPMIMGLTIRYFNFDDVQLYFRVTGQASGYTFGTVNLGALGSGGNLYANLDQFASRSKPAGEVEEEIILILRAYTDAAYSNLKWTYERVVHVVIIDSNDPSYTVDFLNNFDDGTVQGWAASNILNNYGGYPTLAVQTDYVLSTPYSLRMDGRPAIAGPAKLESRLYKSFTTANRDIVYAVFDVRVGGTYYGTYQWMKQVVIYKDTGILVLIGVYIESNAHHMPGNKWMRYVVPLPKNTTLELRIHHVTYFSGDSGTRAYLWMDDFKIISKA